jgi:hypothetical protein
MATNEIIFHCSTLCKCIYKEYCECATNKINYYITLNGNKLEYTHGSQFILLDEFYTLKEFQCIEKHRYLLLLLNNCKFMFQEDDKTPIEFLAYTVEPTIRTYGILYGAETIKYGIILFEAWVSPEQKYRIGICPRFEKYGTLDTDETIQPLKQTESIGISTLRKLWNYIF